MQLISIKATIAMLWVSTVSIAGLAGNLHSFPSWTAVALVALTPPLVMMWQWNNPVPSMSEAIQEARR